MTDVAAYLASAPEPHRSSLEQLRAMLAIMLPNAEEGLSYGVPAFKLDGIPVAGFAYAKQHCSYFPHSGSVLGQVDAYLLKGYTWSTGTLRFRPGTVPEERLIRRLVELRIDELRELSG